MAADGRGKGVFQRQIHGFFQMAFADQFPSFLNGNAGRAGRLAGRKIFFVFPGGNKSAGAAPVVITSIGERAQTRQIADQTAPAQLMFPDLLFEFRHSDERIEEAFSEGLRAIAFRQSSRFSASVQQYCLPMASRNVLRFCFNHSHSFGRSVTSRASGWL